MPLHVRHQLRDAISSVVASTLPTYSALDPNAKAVEPSQLPVYRVIARKELQQADEMAGGTVDRMIEARVILSIQETSLLDDVLDAAAALLEPAILADPTLQDLCQTLEYSGAEIGSAPTGEKKTGAIEIIFMALIQTPEDNPTVIVN